MQTETMKPLLLLVLLPFFNNSPIHYRQLTWDDFRGKPNSDWAALTAYGFEITTIKREGELISQKATAYFNPSQSWTQTDSKEILRHEQLHFAIAHMYAQKLSGNMNADSLFQECYRTQDLYDAETDHSRNLKKQKEWEDKIKM